MNVRPYHHGGLREALLTRAEQTLREAGADGLSLRELARDVGVSHGAPRRHFHDRNALLDALATTGFQRLGEALDQAGEEARAFEVTMARVAIAYVRFATANAALLELMFTSKHAADASPELREAADACFSRMAAVVTRAQSAGELVAGDMESIQTVLFATIQGIASLANSQMIDANDLERTTTYAVRSLLHGMIPESTRVLQRQTVAATRPAVG